MTCTSTPGCTGTITDGYCDVCGMAGAPSGTPTTTPAAAQPAPPAATTPPPTTPPSGAANGQPCGQPGCSGTISDGYCDVCGMAADAAPVAAGGGSGGGETPDQHTLSTITRSSHRLASTALGSSRLGGKGSTATRQVRSGSTRLRAARLGAGLTRVPPAPAQDAAKAVMDDPTVPESKRHCPVCGKPVGRSRDGRPGRTEGFCAHCRNPFSFDPKLHAGDLVAGQYKVAGCLAHGGLGWIYLAQDKNVSDRWVVLKGLLNSGDADALAAAIAEQQFLASVEHPSIVEIYNFVTHDGAGYIVMEYVGGVSLKDILKDRMRANGGLYDPLPVDQAIAYVLEVLPAFQYLHDMGVVYCDFKPDNLIQIGDGIKLIDLGGVRRIDDDESAIYGTVGYQAPEVAEVGTSIASDLYTIGRTLMVLMSEFRGYQSTYLHSLPPVEEMEVFARHDSLYRLMLKVCAPDPADRFASADELRVQLLGVLREVVAKKGQVARSSANSVLFESPSVASNALQWDQLPELHPDPTDPQHSWLSQLGGENEPSHRLGLLQNAPDSSPEVQLARATCGLQLAHTDLVHTVAQEMLAADPWEWRAVWVMGLAQLQDKQWVDAQRSFNAVYGQVPGELAPKLALAVACEYGGELEIAERLYGVCARTDANYAAAGAFGMARVRAARTDIDGAIQALDLVPETSRGYSQSRRLRAEHLLRQGTDLPPLAEAMKSLAAATGIDSEDRHEFTARVLERALDLVRDTHQSDRKQQLAQVRVGDWPADEPHLRDGLEQTYRALAQTADPQQRITLVDKANAARRWTTT